MSLYPFGTARSGLKAASRQQPTINAGQFLRTLLIFVVGVLALGFAARQSHATDGLESISPDFSAAHHAGVISSQADIGLIKITH